MICKKNVSLEVYQVYDHLSLVLLFFLLLCPTSRSHGQFAMAEKTETSVSEAGQCGRGFGEINYKNSDAPQRVDVCWGLGMIDLGFWAADLFLKH